MKTRKSMGPGCRNEELCQTPFKVRARTRITDCVAACLCGCVVGTAVWMARAQPTSKLPWSCPIATHVVRLYRPPGLPFSSHTVTFPRWLYTPLSCVSNPSGGGPALVMQSLLYCGLRTRSDSTAPHVLMHA